MFYGAPLDGAVHFAYFFQTSSSWCIPLSAAFPDTYANETRKAARVVTVLLLPSQRDAPIVASAPTVAGTSASDGTRFTPPISLQRAR